MRVLGMRTGRELDFLVRAFEGDVKPSKECVDIWKKDRYKFVCREVQAQEGDIQSFRVTGRVKDDSKVKSSFLAVVRSICCEESRLTEVPRR